MARVYSLKPRTLDDSTVLYPNTPGKLLLVVLPLCIPLGMLLALPYFLHVFRPIALVCIGIPIMATGFLVILGLLNTWLILSVEIGQDSVLIRNIFRKRRVLPSDVRRVTIDPPVYSDSLEWTWWGQVDSVGRVHMMNGKVIPLALMPNGLKLRIARVLDPENYPRTEEQD